MTKRANAYIDGIKRSLFKDRIVCECKTEGIYDLYCVSCGLKQKFFVQTYIWCPNVSKLCLVYIVSIVHYGSYI